MRDGIAYLEKLARTSVICALLCSLVFFETFVRDTTKVRQWQFYVMQEGWIDRVFVSWTLASSDEDNHGNYQGAEKNKSHFVDAQRLSIRARQSRGITTQQRGQRPVTQPL